MQSGLNYLNMMNVADVEECLIERLSVQEAEARQREEKEIESPDSPPFGEKQEEWLSLIKEMKPGDELWSLSTLRAKKAPVTVLADGYVIKRGDLLVDSIFTMTYF